MNDRYEAWKAARAEAPEPDGFTERVLASAATLRTSRGAAIAIGLAAAAAFALRAASTFLVFAVR